MSMSTGQDSSTEYEGTLTATQVGACLRLIPPKIFFDGKSLKGLRLSLSLVVDSMITTGKLRDASTVESSQLTSVWPCGLSVLDEKAAFYALFERGALTG
jgi:hypothetical protein